MSVMTKTKKTYMTCVVYFRQVYCKFLAIFQLNVTDLNDLHIHDNIGRISFVVNQQYNFIVLISSSKAFLHKLCYPFTALYIHNTFSWLCFMIRCDRNVLW